MFVDCLYKHEEENYISFTKAKKADTDELWLNFNTEGDETLPFPNGESMIPFNAFVEWFNERNLAASMLTDEQAATIPTIYPLWVVDEDVAEGDRRNYGEHLYRCRQPHTTQADYTPDKTPALWAIIEVAHAGTIEDPIPAARGMEYEYGLYYYDSEDGNIYLCQRGKETGTIVLHYMPHELVGQYFELAETEQETEEV